MQNMHFHLVKSKIVFFQIFQDTVNDIDELRRQMIIITSILGGVVVLTLMLVLALAVSISK